MLRGKNTEDIAATKNKINIATAGKKEKKNRNVPVSEAEVKAYRSLGEKAVRAGRSLTPSG